MNTLKIWAQIEEAASAKSLTVIHTGSSEKSDSVYLSIRKPKEVCSEYGILENYEVHVRISNHFNDTNTIDKLSADFAVNIYDEETAAEDIQSIFDFLENCETTYG